MSTKKKEKTFYITTALPYVNSRPHIGFASEIIRADMIARYKKLLGFEVFFNTGTDEHGQKIYQKAIEKGISPQEYVDELSTSFRELLSLLTILPETTFIRTTDEKHVEAAKYFWQKCKEAGYIYKKKYKGLYCVGCELFVTEKDLINGECPDHIGQKPVVVEEENYFFAFSKFQEKLLTIYKENPTFVVPAGRLHEISRFVENGIEDFSISRLQEKMSWGIEVPDDPHHVMYVWFDALVNYVSTIGWPHDMREFEKWWPVVQYAGKDNLRQQAAMWQAMLLSVGLPPSKQIVIDGFVTSEGRKMSKSLGNVIDPLEVVSQYGVEALRYYVARELHPFEDSDVTFSKIKDAYNANLANGIGNLTSRILKMVLSYEVSYTLVSCDEVWKENILPLEYREGFETYNLPIASDYVWKQIGSLDHFIQTHEPFKKIKTDEEAAKKDVKYLIEELWKIALLLEPFLPLAAKEIQRLIQQKEMPKKPLFERK